MKVICVSGTPGTGKTTISIRLSKELGFNYIGVNKLVSRHKISEGYDEKRKTKIVDVDKLNRILIDEITKMKLNKKYKGIIIDSHLSHYLPKKYVNFCIITKCGISELSKRLKKKKFHKEKILENLQSEIFEVCLNEARQRKHRIISADTTKGFNINQLIHKLGE